MAPDKIKVTDSHLGKINTVTGLELDYLNPTPEMICIEDIAQGLANECRFGGQLNMFYSVAQHSVLVSHLVPPPMALGGLLHDGHESVYKDIPSPLKKLLGPAYKQMTDKYDLAVYEKFDLAVDFGDFHIKAADRIALLSESDFLRHNGIGPFMSMMDKYKMTIKFKLIWSPEQSYKMFMERFNQLTNPKKAKA